MRAFARVSLLAVLISAALLRAGEAADPLSDIPEVVAEVNGQKISRVELIRELVGSSGADALDRLVRRKLIEQAAKTAGIEVSQKDIDDEFLVDKSELIQDLIQLPWAEKNRDFPIEDIIRARFRMSVAEYKHNVVRQKLLIARCVAKDYQPTEEQLRAVFNNPVNRDFFQPPVKYRASHILITPLDPRGFAQRLDLQASNSKVKGARQRKIDLYRDNKIKIEGDEGDDIDPVWKKARAKAEKVKGDIDARVITWEQAIREYSHDPHDQRRYNPKTKRHEPSWREQLKPPKPPGDVGYFHKDGPLVKEFFGAVKGRKKDEIVGPIQTEYGYHIIKVTEVQEQPDLTFEQCRARVERLSLDKYLEVRSTQWVNSLVDAADLKTERANLWPPLPAAGVALDPVGNVPEAAAEADPIIGTVNGEAIRRSDVWRELIQADGDEGLKRLMNREIVMTMLKEQGLERMEWECAHPLLRGQKPPPMKPIKIKDETIDLELNDERLRCEAENELRKEQKLPELSFREYVFQRFGQTEKEYRRAIEAGMVLRDAIRQRIPTDDKTLQFYFAFTKETYAEPDWYEISHILIVPEGGMKAAKQHALQDARNLAEEVRRTYSKAPDTWDQLVALFSKDTPENKARGGSLGACYPDEANANIRRVPSGGGIPEGPILYRAIVEQRLEPQPGLASNPIRTARGFHVVKIDKVHKSRPVEFKEVRARLERDYLQERAKMYTDVWLRALQRTLKKKAAVKNYLTPEVDPGEFDAFDQMPAELPLPQE
ncbi:MAG TPA: peptidyl-prolyl cis-trans isomerase [Planctomycetota bacterium]|nr:peptidyl-prolyl cis-trans isomerase [Planctomycetota bacterium]